MMCITIPTINAIDWVRPPTDSLSYCPLSGCTMEGNVNMNGNNIYMDGGEIWNVTLVNAQTINVSVFEDPVYFEDKIIAEKEVELVNSDDNAFNITYTGTEMLSLNNKLFINDSSGNVGIGTDSPKTKLDIHSDIFFQKWYDTDGTANKRRYSFASGGEDFQLSARDDSDAFVRNLMTWQHNGNVGVSTSSPQTNLEVYDDGSNGAVISTRSGSDPINEDEVIGSVDFTSADSTLAEDRRTSVRIVARAYENFNGANNNQADLQFYNSNGNDIRGDATGITPSMVIDGVGRVGMGTTSPSEKLEVNGNVLVNGNLNVTGCIIYNSSGTPRTLGDCI